MRLSVKQEFNPASDSVKQPVKYSCVRLETVKGIVKDSGNLDHLTARTSVSLVEGVRLVPVNRHASSGFVSRAPARTVVHATGVQPVTAS